jgi:6-phosphogluconolactonase/glucosamine-6-phosphate isomerase/deaminase
MFNSIDVLLKQQNILHHSNHAITICSVDEKQGIELSKALLNAVVDRKTAVYLSGGSTPKELYEKLAKDEDLFPGAVGMVDERYGEKFHEKSNEKMIKETGLLSYFQMRDVPFYPMLKSPQPPLGKGGDEGLLSLRRGGVTQDGGFLTREEIANHYDEKVRSLHATFQKSIALLGIGSDGHTAGIAGNRKDFRNPLFDKDRQHLLVSEFNDERGMFKERVTMTFLGLSMLDMLIVLSFGGPKQQALESMFEEGSEEEIPARFYKRPEIAAKTIILTDQMV